MFGLNKLLPQLAAPSQQIVPGSSLGYVPSYVEVPAVAPALVPPPVAKPKPHRARGPRMEGGHNAAVWRAIGAWNRYVSGDATLAQAAASNGSCVAYVRAVGRLRGPNIPLLNAAFHGDVSLLTAAYKTDIATNITVG